MQATPKSCSNQSPTYNVDLCIVRAQAYSCLRLSESGLAISNHQYPQGCKGSHFCPNRSAPIAHENVMLGPRVLSQTTLLMPDLRSTSMCAVRTCKQIVKQRMTSNLLTFATGPNIRIKKNSARYLCLPRRLNKRWFGSDSTVLHCFLAEACLRLRYEIREGKREYPARLLNRPRDGHPYCQVSPIMSLVADRQSWH